MFHHHHHHKTHGHKHEETLAGTSTSSSTSHHDAARVERHSNAPALAEEKIHHKEQVEVQPVVTRDVDRTEVHQVKQPIHETKVEGTMHHTQVLPEKNLEKNFDRGVAPQALPTPTRLDSGTETTVVERAPIIQERVHKKIIEDVQPVVYRDVVQPHTVSVTQPIHEHIVEAPVVMQQTAPLTEGVSHMSLTDRASNTGTTSTAGYATGMTQQQTMSSDYNTGRESLPGHGISSRAAAAKPFSKTHGHPDPVAVPFTQSN